MKKPIVDPKLDYLAFETLYALQDTPIWRNDGIPSPALLDQIDELAEAQVLHCYEPLVQELINRSHVPGSGRSLQGQWPIHERLTDVILASDLNGRCLTDLDSRIVSVVPKERGRGHCWEKCRMRIAKHPSGNPHMWDNMLSRGYSSEKFVDDVLDLYSEFYKSKDRVTDLII